MRGLQLIPHDTKINFTGKRKIAYGFSTFLMIIGLVSLLTKGLNLGIDFKGGLLLEIRTPQIVELSKVRTKLNALQLGEIKLQDFGDSRDLMIRIEKQPGDDAAQITALNKVKHTLGPDVEYRRVETVGSKVSNDLIYNGIWATLFALAGMLIYIWIRFEWQYGLCAIIALLHDVLAVLGFYSLSGLEFNETAFAAILTTIGYSINDSVVVYDRLRENLRRYKTTTLNDVINLSCNETLSRTILTSGTTLLALFALYWLGGQVIEVFALPIFVGILFGTFSSIFISVNLLLVFQPKRPTIEDID